MLPVSPLPTVLTESIEQATSTTVTFQADIDNDAVTETVQYTLTGTDLTMEVWQWNPANLHLESEQRAANYSPGH